MKWNITEFPNPSYEEFKGAENYWLAIFQQWKECFEKELREICESCTLSGDLKWEKCQLDFCPVFHHKEILGE